LADEIVEFANAISPRTAVPVHTFEPEAFARQIGAVRLLQDGETMIVD
jgi:hypothetical protein